MFLLAGEVFTNRDCHSWLDLGFHRFVKPPSHIKHDVVTITESLYNPIDYFKCSCEGSGAWWHTAAICWSVSELCEKQMRHTLDNVLILHVHADACCQLDI